MPDKIRVGQNYSDSRVTLEVNDQGETITFNTKDVGFAKRFSDFARQAYEKQKEMKSIADKAKSNDSAEKEVGELSSENEEDVAIVFDSIDLAESFCSWCEKGIDNVFGHGTSLKVFGGAHIPELYEDFLNQIQPYLTKGREKVVGKYLED